MTVRRLILGTMMASVPMALQAQALPQGTEPAKQVHWAVGAFFGTGWYRVSDNRSVYVLRIPPRQTIRRATLDQSGNRTLGIEIQYALSLGLSKLDDIPDFIDFENYGTISFTPGVRLEFPVNERSSLRAYAHAGYGWEDQSREGALIWYGGFKSRYRLADGRARWSFLSGLFYAGYKPQYEERGQYGGLKVGLETSQPLGSLRLGGDRLYLDWYLTFDWYFDRLNFHVSEDRVESFRDQWEIGMALGKRDRPIKIGFMSFEHIGLAYRFSSTPGFSAITVNLRSPFTY